MTEAGHLVSIQRLSGSRGNLVTQVDECTGNGIFHGNEMVTPCLPDNSRSWILPEEPNPLPTGEERRAAECQDQDGKCWCGRFHEREEW
jgi:hypothetical protein